MATKSIPGMEKIQAITDNAATLVARLAAFAADVRKLYPCGSRVEFHQLAADGERVFLEGVVSDDQFVEAERPGTGLILTVTPEVYGDARQSLRLSHNGRVHRIAVNWEHIVAVHYGPVPQHGRQE